MSTTKTKKPTKTRERKATGNRRTGTPSKPTKTDQLIALLTRPDGASIAEMCKTTGWQKHSVRGAMAGAIRQKGFEVTSEISDGVRRYSIGGKQ